MLTYLALTYLLQAEEMMTVFEIAHLTAILAKFRCKQSVSLYRGRRVFGSMYI